MSINELYGQCHQCKILTSELVCGQCVESKLGELRTRLSALENTFARLSSQVDVEFGEGVFAQKQDLELSQCRLQEYNVLRKRSAAKNTRGMLFREKRASRIISVDEEQLEAMRIDLENREIQVAKDKGQLHKSAGSTVGLSLSASGSPYAQISELKYARDKLCLTMIQEWSNIYRLAWLDVHGNVTSDPIAAVSGRLVNLIIPLDSNYNRLPLEHVHAAMIYIVRLATAFAKVMELNLPYTMTAARPVPYILVISRSGRQQEVLPLVLTESHVNRFVKALSLLNYNVAILAEACGVKVSEEQLPDAFENLLRCWEKMSEHEVNSLASPNKSGEIEDIREKTTAGKALMVGKVQKKTFERWAQQTGESFHMSFGSDWSIVNK